MSSGTAFRAPWGTPLKAVSVFTVVLLVGIAVTGLLSGPRTGVDCIIWFVSMTGVPLLVLLFAVPFAVTGYVLSRTTLLVKRVGWYSRIDLRELVDAEVNPKAMARSIRTFGNGGLFGFSGLYWNRKLGFYRAYVTDFSRCVILRFSRRVIVISPDDPETFVRNLKMLRGM